MKYTNLSARVEVEDKNQFEKFCDNTGMNVSVAINLFIKTVLRENRIPFSIKVNPSYSKQNIKAIQENILQMQNGKTIVKTFSDLKEMESE